MKHLNISVISIILFSLGISLMPAPKSNSQTRVESKPIIAGPIAPKEVDSAFINAIKKEQGKELEKIKDKLEDGDKTEVTKLRELVKKQDMTIKMMRKNIKEIRIQLVHNDKNEKGEEYSDFMDVLENGQVRAVNPSDVPKDTVHILDTVPIIQKYRRQYILFGKWKRIY